MSIKMDIDVNMEDKDIGKIVEEIEEQEKEEKKKKYTLRPRIAISVSPKVLVLFDGLLRNGLIDTKTFSDFVNKTIIEHYERCKRMVVVIKQYGRNRG